MGIKDPTTLKYWLRTIETEGYDDLNEWEKDFVRSIKIALNLKNSLSTAQEDKLEALYIKITS